MGIKSQEKTEGQKKKSEKKERRHCYFGYSATGSLDRGAVQSERHRQPGTSVLVFAASSAIPRTRIFVVIAIAELAVETSDMDWNAAITLSGFRVTTRGDQALHHVEVASLTSDHEWRAAILVRSFPVATRSDQALHHVEVAFLTSDQEWRAAILVRSFLVATSSDQPLHNI